MHDIWCSQSGVQEDISFWDLTPCHWIFPTFQIIARPFHSESSEPRRILRNTDSLNLKIKALRYFETSVNIYQSIWLNIQNTLNLQNCLYFRFKELGKKANT